MSFTFISYSHSDESFALELYSFLKTSGVTLWMDRPNIARGAEWEREIEQALDDCSSFIVLLSSSSVHSDYVRSEVHTALEEGKLIVPVRLEACRPMLRLRTRQLIDISEGGLSREQALEEVLSALGGVADGREQTAERVSEIEPPKESNKWVECPSCNQPVKTKNFARHWIEGHGFKWVDSLESMRALESTTAGESVGTFDLREQVIAAIESADPDERIVCPSCDTPTRPRTLVGTGTRPTVSTGSKTLWRIRCRTTSSIVRYATAVSRRRTWGGIGSGIVRSECCDPPVVPKYFSTEKILTLALHGNHRYSRVLTNAERSQRSSRQTI